MICCGCRKEIKRNYNPDSRMNGLYCKECAKKINDITPEEFEAYLMTNWRSLTRNRWEVELPGVDGSGEDHGSACKDRVRTCQDEKLT